jgi:glucose/arabinose dehydrogenase
MGKTLILLIAFALFSSVYAISGAAHDGYGGNVYGFVRVVEGNPDTRTYTFNCMPYPEYHDATQDIMRHWAISADSEEPNEFEIHQSGSTLTYTFEKDEYYHIGCQITYFVEHDGQWMQQTHRGDVHIDLRTERYNPEVIPLAAFDNTVELYCDYTKGPYSVEWDVIDITQGGAVYPLGNDKTLVHTATQPGLYDYRCFVTDLNTGEVFRQDYPVEHYEPGNPFLADIYGVPDGIYHSWERDRNPIPNKPWIEGYDPDDTPEQPPEEPPEQPPGEQVCYSSVADIPAVCMGGTITTESNLGSGKRVVCENGGNRLEITAWDKEGYFEMYKQSQSGIGIEICLAEECISTSSGGFMKSNDFPICTEGSGEQPPHDPGSGILNPRWITPTNNSDRIGANYFHIELIEEQGVSSTDIEIWNDGRSSIVWSAYGLEGTLRFHAHTPDGTFSSGMSALSYDTHYWIRARYYDLSGNSYQWSDWMRFRTLQEHEQVDSSLLWTAAHGFRVEEFASGLEVPVQLDIAPQHIYGHLPENERPYLYVTELYGRVKVIFQDGSSSVYADNLLNFEPFGSITGGGEMGVVGLYVDQDTGDVYVTKVYLEGDEVKNRILRFVTNDAGNSYTQKIILLENLPSSPSHQAQSITRGPDRKIYVNLGDALRTSFPQDDSVLAGKIIRMNDDGSNVEIYAKGFRNPFGSAWRPNSNQLFITDNGPDDGDRLLYVQQGGNYGWCCDLTTKTFPLEVSPVGMGFNTGNSGLPSYLDGRLYVAVAGPIYAQGQNNAKHILEFVLTEGGSVASHREFVRYTGSGYGTPMDIAFGHNGLYFTDIYGEQGFIGLGVTNGRIYRVVEGYPEECPECNGQEFSVGISVAPWFPKDTGNGIEYIFECRGFGGSGSFEYHLSFGDGNQESNSNGNFHQVYPYGDQEYDVVCTVTDLIHYESAQASMTINPANFISDHT